MWCGIAWRCEGATEQPPVPLKAPHTPPPTGCPVGRRAVRLWLRTAVVWLSWPGSAGLLCFAGPGWPAERLYAR